MAEDCWPRYGAYIAAVIQSMYILVSCSSNVVLCGAILDELITTFHIPIQLWIVLVGIIAFPTLFTKHFSHVAWFSLISFLALLAIIFLVLGYGFSTYHTLQFDQIPFWDLKGTFIAFPVVVFGFSGVIYLPTLEENMKNPNDFNVVLAISYVPSFLLKLLFGLFGFVLYYPNIDQVITNSIPHATFKIIVSCIVFINVSCSYPFESKALIQCIEDSITKESLRSKFDSLL